MIMTHRQMARILFCGFLGGVALCGVGASQAEFRVLTRLPGVLGVTQGMYTAGIHIDDVLDVTGDGVPDLVGAFGNIVIAIGDGRGGFGPWVPMPPPRPDGMIRPAYGDVDSDGDIDVYCGVLNFANRDAPDEIYINDGWGRFTVEGSSRLPRSGHDTHACALVDVDGDGDLDAVLGGYMSWWVPGGRGRNWIYLNDGAGRFTEDLTRASLPPDSDDTVKIVSGDVDGDGDLDLLFGNLAVGALQNHSKVYINDGSGHFALSQSFPANLTWVPRLFDMDGDRDLDLAFFSRGQTVRIPHSLWESDGTGRFTDVSSRLPAGDSFSGADFGDIDGDGDIDIVCVAYPVEIGNGEVRSVFQWVNDGAGRFTDVTGSTMPTFTERSHWGAYQLAAAHLADLDLDGDLDIILSDNGNFTPPDNNPILWNMTRHVYAPVRATIGQSYKVDFYARAGNLVLPAAAFAAVRIRLGAMGVLGLDPATLVVGSPLRIGPTGEKASLTFQVPHDPSLVGRKLYWQGLEVDPLRPPFYRLTNTFEETIGA